MSPLDRITQMNQQLADAREQLARDSATIATAHRDNTALAERLTAAELERDKLGAELAASRKWIENDSVRIGELVKRSEKAESDLARVTAEREEMQTVLGAWTTELTNVSALLAALRARVAELTCALRKIMKLAVDGSSVQRIATAALASAESATPVKNAVDTPENREACKKVMADWEAEDATPANHSSVLGMPQYSRIWSAAPAKHPDTERLEQVACIAHDGGLANLSEHEALCVVRRLTGSHWVSDLTLADRKSRIDAARKQGGIAHE